LNIGFDVLDLKMSDVPISFVFEKCRCGRYLAIFFIFFPTIFYGSKKEERKRSLSASSCLKDGIADMFAHIRTWGVKTPSV
jgi:hypothetical protein